MKRALGLTLAAAVLAAGCGKSPEQKQAEQIQKSATDMQKSAESMAKGFEDMAKGLNAMSGGDPNAKPVDPVSFKDLQGVLADLPGWERGKASGERMTSPVTYAEASVTFRNGDARIEQKITDSAMNQMPLAPAMIVLAGNFQRETDTGYEKSIKVGDNPGWGKWNSESKSGELHVFVNKRFLVELEGSNLADMKAMRQALDKTDLKKLASLK